MSEEKINMVSSAEQIATIMAKLLLLELYITEIIQEMEKFTGIKMVREQREETI